FVADVSVNKLVNYCLAYGISSGERLHTAVYKALTSLLSKGEICAFDGRTCFALLIKSTDRNSTIIRVSEMLDKIVRIIPHGGISLRAGIFFPEVSEEQGSPLTARVTDPLICYNNAHAALVSLPDENANSVKVYDLSIAEKRLWIRHVEDGLQRALKKEEFLVYIQPKYNPKTNELAGAEALIRWENATDGFIAPYRFIPILEQNRTITKVDDYMLDHVARYQAEWLAEGKEVVPVSVNLSRTHFSDADLADHIASIVDKYNLPHKYIEIELTESAFFDNAEQLLQLVKDIKAKGFEISMDDFGSGYSSLNSLINLPLDVLKLDAGFFRDLQDEEKARTVVLAAIRLAKKLNMRIVAEGVEEKAQVDYLAEQGCDMIQGYYYEKPMPAAEYAELMGKPARVS
ncbi:MAG: EAL domain-containing protein, partial [Parasporobacterium sp.]|nr:EAL domain-containing protein [Parasporobacterium sp.]